MEYVDKEYYENTFHGEPVSEADFPALLARASEQVEELTLYQLTPTSFLVMPVAVQERIKKAVCAQIEYLDANGGSELDNAVFPVRRLENSVILEHPPAQVEVQSSPVFLPELSGCCGLPV